MSELATTLEVVPERSDRSVLRRNGLTDLDAALLAVVAVYTVAWVPVLASPSLPRLALLYLLAPAGVVVVLRGALARDRAHIAALALMLVLVVSSLQSANPLHSLKGGITSWLATTVYLAAIGWWALGRSLSDRGRTLLPWVLLAGLGVNTLIGVLQIALEIDRGSLAAIAGRASGLMGNPVFFGSYAAGLAAWAFGRLSERTSVAFGAITLFAAFATGLSGSRVAEAAVLAVGVALIAMRRSVGSIIGLVATIVGFVASTAVARTSTGSSAGADRLVTSDGLGLRMDVWRFGLDGFLDRPILGHGPNQFSYAVDRYFTLAFLRDNPYPPDLQPWPDPHNVVILMLVTVGVVGAVGMAAFVWYSARGSLDVALVAAAVAIVLTWMMQPAQLPSLGVAVVLWGAAVRPSSRPTDEPGHESAVGSLAPDEDSDAVESTGRDARTWMAIAAVAGLAIASYHVVVSYRLEQAANSGDPDRVAAAAEWFVHDGSVSGSVSRTYLTSVRIGVVDVAEGLEQGLAWAERAVGQDPSPQAWNSVAELLIGLGRFTEATDALDEAERLQEWNAETVRLRIFQAEVTGDETALADALDRACQLELDECTGADE